MLRSLQLATVHMLLWSYAEGESIWRYWLDEIEHPFLKRYLTIIYTTRGSDNRERAREAIEEYENLIAGTIEGEAEEVMRMIPRLTEHILVQARIYLRAYVLLHNTLERPRCSAENLIASINNAIYRSVAHE